MKAKIKNFISITATLGSIILFFWIVNHFFGGESAENEPARIICKKNWKTYEKECFITAHIHAQLRVFKDGKEVPLRYEVGNLSRNHTHAQKNILHWHGLIKIDPEKITQAPNYDELRLYDEFRVGKIPQDFNFPYKGTPKFIVNGKKVKPSYKWKVNDIIEVHYD